MQVCRGDENDNNEKINKKQQKGIGSLREKKLDRNKGFTLL